MFGICGLSFAIVNPRCPFLAKAWRQAFLVARLVANGGVIPPRKTSAKKYGSLQQKMTCYEPNLLFSFDFV